MSDRVKSVTLKVAAGLTSTLRTLTSGLDGEVQVDIVNRLVRIERDGAVYAVLPFENVAGWTPLEQKDTIQPHVPEIAADALKALGYREAPSLKVVPAPTAEATP